MVEVNKTVALTFYYFFDLPGVVEPFFIPKKEWGPPTPSLPPFNLLQI